jgi:hypothetical protein
MMIDFVWFDQMYHYAMMMMVELVQLMHHDCFDLLGVELRWYLQNHQYHRHHQLVALEHEHHLTIVA